MHWKKCPYWLRGGVIGGVAAALITALNASCLYLFAPFGSWGLECALFTFLLVPLEPLYVRIIPSFYTLSSIQLLFIDIVGFFFLGSLIGAFVELIKKMKALK